MPVEDRAISDFPIALQLLNTALVLISNPVGQDEYDSYQTTLTEIGRVILETQYTQDLGNVDVFDAIKNCRTLSGTTNPTALQGVDGQLYVKYTTSGNTTTVNGLYVKLSGAWAEISTGGGGGDVGIECTQAQYDAWEQAGTLLADTNYYITDGQSGGGVVIDDTTASLTTVYSSDKVEDLLSEMPRELVLSPNNYKFGSMTWTTSGSGIYYATIDLDNILPSGTKIVGITINGWNNIRPTDNIIPYIRTNRTFGLMSNVNTFADNNSAYGFSILYV